MAISDYLKKLGLSDKEAKTYLATLEIGSGTIKNIADKAGLKRPTTYLIVDNLTKLGLLSQSPQQQNRCYFAENPEKLRSILREKERVYQEAIPFLRSIYSREQTNNRPSVRIYEGEDAMRQMYLDTIWKTKEEVWFFSSIQKLNEAIPGLLTEWTDHVYKQGIKTKELINPTPVDIKYAQYVENERLGEQQIRIIPSSSKFKFVSADNVLFEDKIIMSVFTDKLFTTVIQSQALTDTFRALFENAWEQAMPLGDYLSKVKKSG
ncbi:MAG TPA: helix-turn-helix domain-containing protein [Patescibacteria group bacterium]|nr:helix-turn-helix domain-containing protein [Patescibacteria group bacterium]